MGNSKIEKRHLLVVFLFFFSFAILLALADRAPIHLDKRFPCIQLNNDNINYVEGIIHSTASGPYVYRIFIPFLVKAIQAVFPSLSILNIDLILKILFLILCQVTFYYYLRNFYHVIISLVGVFILDILLSFTFSSIIGPAIGENADLFNIVIFSLLLNALYKNQFSYVLAYLFIGTFNRETTWFLIPVIFIWDYYTKRKLFRTAIAFITVAIPYFGLRSLIHSPSPGWFNFDAIANNIPFIFPGSTSSALIANAHTLFLLGPLIIMSLMNFKNNPKFLQMVSYITPLFIVLHYIVGNIIETRLWLPLFILLIPLSLTTMNNLFNLQQVASNPLHEK
jgi:hypothetical protein